MDEDAMLYGSAIHNIMALYFTSMSLHPTPKQIELYIEKAFEDGFNFIMKGKVRKTNTIKKNFLEFELRRLKTWKQYKPTFVEKRFKVTIFPDLPDFIGYLDFYSQEDETIIDWKSGGLEMNEPTKIQGKVYELAMQAMNLPASKSLFFALRDGRLLEVPKLTKGWLYQICKDMFEQVRDDIFPPKLGPLCGWCPHILRCQFEGKCLWMLE